MISAFHRLSSNRKAQVVITGALFILLFLIFRFAIHYYLYRAGFTAMTADEFGRVVVAATWSKHPETTWPGFLLPFHPYLLGTALRIIWELLWIPRILTLALGFLSIIFVYGLTYTLFKSQLAALIGTTLLVVNPVHTWLSSMPLAEIPEVTFALGGAWAFCIYLDRSKLRYAFLAALALALASGFRFEAWVLSGLFSLAALTQLAWKFKHQNIWPREGLALLTVAAIPWIFPLSWSLRSYIATHDPLSFFALVRDYKLQWYGSNIYYGGYFNTILAIDPFMPVLGSLGLVACLWKQRSSNATLWYLSIATIPLVVFITLHGGQLEPQGNYLRYLAPFVFFFYPAVGYLIASGLQASGSIVWRLSLILLVGLMVVFQIRSTVNFTNDPAGDGLAVGQALRALREQHPELVGRDALVELSYWEYLAIQVGANDIDHIVFDRAVDPETHQGESLLLTNDEAFNACIKDYGFGVFILKDPHLIKKVENKYHLQPVKVINNYSFFLVSDQTIESLTVNPSKNCPLHND